MDNSAFKEKNDKTIVQKESETYGKILVVDDHEANRVLIQEALEGEGYTVIEAEEGFSGYKAAVNQQPDIILLDIMMPEVDGYKVCSQLKKHPSTKDIPVIFITGMDKLEDVLKGFSLGAVDYVKKPVKIAEVLARVKTQLKLRRLEKEKIEAAEAKLKSAHWESIKAISEGIAHNFNNILAAVMGNLQYIQPLMNDKDGKEAVEDSLESMERAKKLVELLQIYQTLSPDFCTAEIIDIVHDAQAGMEESMDMDCVVEIEVMEAMPKVPAQIAPYMRVAIREGLKNAYEAMKNEKGKITIKAWIEEDESYGNFMIVEIEDNGKGIEDDVARKAFLPFFSTKNIVGVGLGLFSSKIALEQVKGKMTLKENKKGVVTAKITVPVRKEDMEIT
jgi:two-component system, sensor histidine kinase and response regulator